MDIGPVRPLFHGGIFGNEKRFRFKMSGFDQGEPDCMFPVSEVGHGDVVPVLSGRNESAVDKRDRFRAADRRVSEIGAQVSASLFGNAEGDPEYVSGVKQFMVAGGGCLYGSHGAPPCQ